MATDSELLTLVETAIEARLNGGAIDQHSADGVQFQKTPLPDLMKMRDDLKAKIARQTAGGQRYADLRGHQ